jgi:uncharacterized pyridoxamine 5'-phosphate oxidase family protein
MSKEEVLSVLQNEEYGILVTSGKTGMTSRTMTFAFCPDDKLFMMTHKGTAKLDDIYFNPRGLIHVNAIKEKITESYDISIEGEFQFLDPENSLFETGKELLGRKNPMVRNILGNKDSRSHYELLIFYIRSLKANDYMQALNGEPKTILI